MGLGPGLEVDICSIVHVSLNHKAAALWPRWLKAEFGGKYMSDRLAKAFHMKKKKDGEKVVEEKEETLQTL